MRSIIYLCMSLLIVSCTSKEESKQELSGTLQLHPENPHYFLYNGKAIALVTSGEHYGAVLNLAFDYEKYLKTLQDAGLNYTRVFGGSYFEEPGAFGILNNTLAPEKDKVISPWQKTEDGKYDLSKFNTAFFDRLKAFVSSAKEKGIIVEVTLFSSIYNEENWKINPQNPNNNQNIEEDLTLKTAQIIGNGSLLDFQKAYVEKIVHELNDFDNVFYEVRNEPWSDNGRPVYNVINTEELEKVDWRSKVDVPIDSVMQWQEEIASTIVKTESVLPKKHLIAQNFSNYQLAIPTVSPHVSILNFHYAWPEAVKLNYHYNKVVGFDESGFAGNTDKVYRKQAWRFILSGGGLFNHLDYSFSVGFEDGTLVNEAPGGGSVELRKQLKYLSDFIHSFPLEKMKPAEHLVIKSTGAKAYFLSSQNGFHALLLQSMGYEKTDVLLNLEAGAYQIEFLNPITGEWFKTVDLKAEANGLELALDIPDGELALRIRKK